MFAVRGVFLLPTNEPRSKGFLGMNSARAPVCPQEFAPFLSERRETPVLSPSCPLVRSVERSQGSATPSNPAHRLACEPCCSCFPARRQAARQKVRQGRRPWKQ